MSHLGEFLVSNPGFTRIGAGLLLVIGSYLIGRRLIEIEKQDKEYERKRKYRINPEENERRYL
jgi:hypothetical protein